MDKSEISFISTKGYEMINDNLGSGSFGKTVLLRDKSIDEFFVCKKYQPQPGLSKEEFYSSFKKEIKLMYKINHPNVVRIYNYYLYDSTYFGYILMEYIEGKNIDNWFSEYIGGIDDANDIFRQLIEGFCCIEKSGIIHRDIRESNILITKRDEVKIIDFGLGKNVNDNKLSTDSFNTLINRAQMVKFPNEFAQCKYTSKTDMFCLAEMFDRLLKKYDIKDFRHNYILQKMMNVDADKRYASFKEILKALDKKEFKRLDISEDDKSVYNAFMNEVLNCLGVYREKPTFEKNPSIVIDGIEQILNDNCLNYNIGNNSSLISVFLKGNYTFYSKRSISVDTVQDFYNWINGKDADYQQVVINNVVNRLSTVKVEIEEELPF